MDIYFFLTWTYGGLCVLAFTYIGASSREISKNKKEIEHLKEILIELMDENYELEKELDLEKKERGRK